MTSVGRVIALKSADQPLLSKVPVAVPFYMQSQIIKQVRYLYSSQTVISTSRILFVTLTFVINIHSYL